MTTLNPHPPVIELRQVYKHYTLGQTQCTALKNISLTIEQGEMIAIIGTSGSGKSTLMNLIGLLDSPDSGEIFLNGKTVSALQEKEKALLRNHSIGFVFQQFHLLPRFNAEQNVALPLYYREMSPHQISQKVNEELYRVGMSAYRDHKPTELSGGQQQRIAIARALIGKPDIILADEPTGALDSQTGQDIMEIFKTLHQEGRTLILVTHDEKIAACCPRQIILKDGQIIKDSRS